MFFLQKTHWGLCQKLKETTQTHLGIFPKCPPDLVFASPHSSHWCFGCKTCFPYVLPPRTAVLRPDRAQASMSFRRVCGSPRRACIGTQGVPAIFVRGLLCVLLLLLSLFTGAVRWDLQGPHFHSGPLRARLYVCMCVSMYVCNVCSM